MIHLPVAMLAKMRPVPPIWPGRYAKADGNVVVVCKWPGVSTRSEPARKWMRKAIANGDALAERWLVAN